MSDGIMAGNRGIMDGTAELWVEPRNYGREPRKKAENRGITGGSAEKGLGIAE